MTADKSNQGRRKVYNRKITAIIRGQSAKILNKNTARKWWVGNYNFLQILCIESLVIICRRK